MLTWKERALVWLTIAWADLCAIARFIAGRFGERSTWVSLASGVTAAAALEWPWSGIFLAMSFIGVLIPDGPVKPE